MLLRTVLPIALVAVVGAQAAPKTTDVVTAARAYVTQYQRDFIYLVADEVTTQHVAERDVVTATRTTRGEMFATFLEPNRVWMSVHDVTDVDGVPVANRTNVRSLLEQESISAIAPRVAEANAQFNIGRVTRNFNEPTLALLVFTPQRTRDVTFDRDRVERAADGETLVKLEFRGRDGASLVRSHTGRVTMRGSAVVEFPSGRVRQTRVTFSDGVVDATLDTGYARDARLDLWVPVTFDEQYVARRTQETTSVRTTFSNYRRFETRGWFR